MSLVHRRVGRDFGLHEDLAALTGAFYVVLTVSILVTHTLKASKNFHRLRQL
jgi:hypothetical protein